MLQQFYPDGGCHDEAMALDVELSETRDFLAHHEPFDALPDAVLDGSLPTSSGFGRVRTVDPQTRHAWPVRRYT